MIEPIDEEERAVLLRALVIERFGHPPHREGTNKSPKTIAARRRVLAGIEKKSASKETE